MVGKIFKHDRRCLECGRSPISGYKYCSKACLRKATFDRVRIRAQAAGRPSMQELSERARANQWRTCEQCAKRYQSKRSNGDGERFCSRECGFAYQKWIGAKQRAARRVRYVFHRKICAKCGEKFTDQKLTGSYCSQWCAYESDRLKYREHECINCGQAFVPADVYDINGPGTFSQCCSEECRTENQRKNKKAYRRTPNGKAVLKRSKIKRRTRTNGQLVRSDVVFKLDGWRCYLCGCRTHSFLIRTNDPKEPTIDHVIPLSKGGAHNYSNVRCCCRRCNYLKSDN